MASKPCTRRPSFRVIAIGHAGENDHPIKAPRVALCFQAAGGGPKLRRKTWRAKRREGIGDASESQFIRKSWGTARRHAAQVRHLLAEGGYTLPAKRRRVKAEDQW
jgi:hypothetical protein